MSATTLTDRHGHNWPVSGSWCSECGMPLARAIANESTHPNCDPLSPKPRLEVNRDR